MNKNLSNEEFVRRISKVAQLDLSLRVDDDYEINNEQMDKYLEVCQYFETMAKEHNGSFKAEKLIPSMCHGGVTAEFVTFVVATKEEAIRFGEIVSMCSEMSIDGLLNGQICISCTVPDLFKKKKV